MPGINDLDEDIFDDELTPETEDEAGPSVARKVIAKMQSASDWYAETVHPYILAAKQPVTYVMWCAATFAVIAGLPTAKAIFADPYTELSSVLVEQEILEAERKAQSLRNRS